MKNTTELALKAQIELETIQWNDTISNEMFGSDFVARALTHPKYEEILPVFGWILEHKGFSLTERVTLMALMQFHYEELKAWSPLCGNAIEERLMIILATEEDTAHSPAVAIYKLIANLYSYGHAIHALPNPRLIFIMTNNLPNGTAHQQAQVRDEIYSGEH